MRWLATVLLALGGCTAQIGGGGEDAGPGPSSDAGPLPPDTCTTRSVGPTPIRRLTRSEYNRTVRDLLGDTTSPASAFLPDAVAFGFDNNAVVQSVSPALIEQQLHAAETMAKAVTDDADRLRGILPCDPVVIGALACGEAFIEAFTPRAFRRPITEEERLRYRSVFGAGLASGFRTGIRRVITAALMSPGFLYQTALGTGPADADGLVTLDGYELASRLSYLVWGSMPDQDLFDAAKSGALGDPAALEAQVERMLADPRASDGLGHFAEQWLEIESLSQVVKDPVVFPEATLEAREAMLQGALRFHEEVMLNADLRALFTAQHAWVNRSTASIAGSTSTSRSLVRVDLPAGERAGILTDLAVLSVHAKINQTSPVLRGRFVREQLLCQPLMAPPDNVNTTPPEPVPGATTRERFSQHRADPACAGCHQMMDPLGFGFEGYDGIGRRRLLDNDLPVDDSGEIIGFTGGNRTFEGAVELGQILAASDQVAACLGQQWFRYALGRVESIADRCSLKAVSAEVAANDGRLRSILTGLVKTEAFRFRLPVDAPTECAP